MTSVQKIGVIGAGTTGSGIAQVCAIAGLSVVMMDAVMDLVEMVHSPDTEHSTIEAAVVLAQPLGKTPVPGDGLSGLHCQRRPQSGRRFHTHEVTK